MIDENLFIILVSESSTLSYRENSLDCPGFGPLSTVVIDFFELFSLDSSSTKSLDSICFVL